MVDSSPRELLGALARGDMGKYQEFAKELEPETDEKARSLILAGLLVLLERKWEETTPLADIRLWVADFRNFMERSLGELDPVSCERIIVGILLGKPEMIEAVPPEQRTNLIGLLTFKMAYDTQMTDEELIEFLSEAEELDSE